MHLPHAGLSAGHDQLRSIQMTRWIVHSFDRFLLEFSHGIGNGEIAANGLFCSQVRFACGQLRSAHTMSSKKRHPHSGQGFIPQTATQKTIIPGLGVDLPELQQARALWMANRFDDALQLFEKAVRTHPQNLVALVDASRALGARFEIQRAEEMLDRLMKVGARQPNLLHLAGQSYRMIFRPEKAMNCFERVLAMTKDIPDACLELAVLSERRHRVEEAYDLIPHCSQTDPGYVEAQLFKDRLLRRRKDDAPSEALFRELAANEQA